MKALVILVIVAAVVAVLVGIRRTSQNGLHSAEATAAQQTLEQKLDFLAQCGLNLADPFTIDDLLRSQAREDYERPRFARVLTGLGMTEEQEPWRSHCLNLWHFDGECIAEDGDYKRIAERMAEMTQGSLTFSSIDDHVDVEKQEAWLSFTFEGQQIRIDCKVENDWVDPAIFGKFVDLLKQSDPSKTYIYYDLGGQDCIIGCVTKEAFDRLRAAGIQFVPLT